MRVLAMAAAYYVAGRLALTLAIPPGYATAVWPAAGIALAGTLLMGWRMWPGILLGSFLINAWTGVDSGSAGSVWNSIAVAGGIGLGAALQAVTGAALVRRFVGFPTPLTQAGDVIKFLMLGGPAGCLVNATVSVITLGVARQIAISDCTLHWWTWWAGDVIGTWAVAPLILIWASPTSPKISRRRQISVSLPLCVAFGLIVILFMNARNWEPGQSWGLLAGGLLLTGLMGALLLVVTGHTVEVEGLIERHKQAEQRFRTAVEAAPNAMLTVDRQGRMTLVNSQAERLFGYARDELLGQSVEMLVPERYRAQHPAHRAGFFNAPDARPMGAGRDLFGLRKNGTEVPIEIGLNPIQTPEGTFVLASIIDITGRKDAENALKESLRESRATIERQEKLASLGVLAAGVAHEIRNPLTAIKFRLFSLRKSLPGTAASNEDATVIGNEINRLERIVKGFLLFARPTEPELVTVPANRLLGDVHELLHPQLAKSNIRLILEAGADPWVRVDTQQLKQVLINLIQNAADSIGRDGTITLRATRDPGSPRSAVVLEVADTGKGVSPEVQERLFDPFFTTKEGGTGLGLPIAARIVEKHGGELQYRTQINRGTTFSIRLPPANHDET